MQRYPDASYKEMHGRIVCLGLSARTTIFTRGCPAELCKHRPLPGFHLNAEKSLVATYRALDEESLYYSGLICSLEALRADVHRLSITMPLRRISAGALHIAQRIFKSWPARDDLF